jgi:hypothetical protein
MFFILLSCGDRAAVPTRSVQRPVRTGQRRACLGLPGKFSFYGVHELFLVIIRLERRSKMGAVPVRASIWRSIAVWGMP